jgi:hypothetical protein
VRSSLGRSLWPAVALLTVMAWRSAGCQRKAAAPKDSVHNGKVPTAMASPHFITPLMTPPPPRPTVTLWKGATRAPALPE